MVDHNISIDVKLMSEKVISELKGIRDDLNDIKSHSNITVNIKAPNIANITRSVNELRQDLSAIANMGMQGNRNNADAIIESIGTGVEGLLNKMDELNNKQVNLDVNSDGLEQAASTAERLASALDVAGSIASSVSSVFSGLGDFGGMFASSFDAMSNMFSFDAMGTAKRYLTAMATKAVTGQISGIISRYDIMNTFEDYMELAGVSRGQANAALNAVDQSIRGIPIGLDEAAFRLRKYQMYLGDIDRTTAFTIGIQKAITAGGASEQMKTTAYTQIDRLLATGKLGQSRQWLSLFNGLGVSLKFLKEELGLDPNADLKEVASQLASGAIPVENFIDAIARLSENEGLDKAIEIYKGTIEAWASNINNAVKRAGQNIMENVNDVMEDTLGFGITGAMKQVRDGIDTISKEAGNYIQQNPQHVQTISEAIGGLVGRAMTLDGGRFISNVINNVSGIADVFGRIFDNLPDNFIEDFVSFATTWAGPLATVSKAAQGGLGAVIGVFERMQELDPAELIEKIVGQIENMAGVVSGLLGLIPDGLLGDLMAFGLVWGKPLASVLGTVGNALKNISSGLRAGSFGEANGLFGQLTWLVTNHPLIVAAVAAIAGAVGAYTQLMKGYDEWYQGIIDGGKLNTIMTDVERLAERSDEIRENFDGSMESYNQSMDEIERKAKDASELLQTVLETDQKIGESIEKGLDYDNLYNSQIENIEKLKTIMPELSGILGLDTQGRLLNAAALQEQGDAYIEYVKKMAQAEAIAGAMSTAYQTQLQAETTKYLLKQKRQALDAEYITANAYLDSHGSMEVMSPEEQGLYMYYNDVVGHYFEDRAKVQAEIDEAGDTAEDAAEQFEMYGDKLAEVTGETQQMADNGDIDKINQAIDETGTTANETTNKIAELAQAYSDLKDAAEESIRSQISLFSELKNASEHTLAEAQQNIGGNLTELDRRKQALQRVNEFLYGDTNGPGGNSLSTSTKEALSFALGEMFDANEIGMIEQFLAGTELTGKDYYDWVANTVGDLVDYYNAKERPGGTSSDIAAERAKLGHLQEAGGDVDLATVAQEVEELGNTTETTGNQAETASEQSEEYAEKVELMDSASTQATTSIQNMGGAVTSAGGAASSKSGDMGALAAHISQVSAAASFAAWSVNNLASAINSLQDKTVTVAVNMLSGGQVSGIKSVATSTMRGIASAFFPAWGGEIGYLADGGFPGIGRGTDTVPAWLTPGEYVMRRSAVGLFGSHFMNRVNKMDIGGAFDALMMRISNPRYGYGATYNRDNHATVINHFYGDNGQGYSQRKAYRFAGSL